MKTILLYFNTIKYLKPIQIFYRIKYALYKRHTEIKLSNLNLRILTNPNFFFVKKKNIIISKNKFLLLNKIGDLNKIGWNGKNYSKLWLYNLHYFDYLNSNIGIKKNIWNKYLIYDWIKNNPFTNGVGWDPYPLSLRLVNLIKWVFNGNKIDNVIKDSIELQVRFLLTRLEYHILGNHLFANAKALVFAGVFFDGPEAKKWFDRGLEIVNKEILEQVLPDGGHFELTPMYHSIFLEDILDLYNLAVNFKKLFTDSQKRIFHDTAIKMIKWLKTMLHPDKEISFFNDSCIGTAPSPNRLFAYAKKLGIENTYIKYNKHLIFLKNSGYIRVKFDKYLALLDVGNIGPSYLPGHGHADLFSFEMSLNGKRFIVNSGTSEYKSGKIRDLERSTKAHNTLAVNKLNSSEIWGEFRVAKRAYPKNLEIFEKENLIKISGYHNGYSRGLRKIIHKRTWFFSEKYIEICDELGGKIFSAYAYYHFHPDIQITPCDKGEYHILFSNKINYLIKISAGSSKIIDGHFSPSFGCRLNKKYLRVSPDKFNNIKFSISLNN